MAASDSVTAPDLQGRRLTRKEYGALTPEKLELPDGYLCGGADDNEERVKSAEGSGDQ